MIMKIIHRAQLTVVTSFVFIGISFADTQEMVDRLGDDDFLTREKAEKELGLWVKDKGKEGFDELNELKKKETSPEILLRLDQVLSGMSYSPIPGTQGFMGIAMFPIMGGSLISGVNPGTPAEKAGLQPNDKIIEIDGIDLSQKTQNLDEATDFLRIYVRTKKAGEKLSLKLDRNGNHLSKDLKLADYNTEMARLGEFGQQGIEILPMQGNRRIFPQGKIQGLNAQQNQDEIDQLNRMLQDQLKGRNKHLELRIEGLRLQDQKNKQKMDLFKGLLESKNKQLEELKQPAAPKK